MIFRKLSNTRTSGFILADIFVALAVLTMFMATGIGISIDTKRIFETARGKSALLKVYDSHKQDFDGLMPYESRSNVYEDVSIRAIGKWYGNDQIETFIQVTDGLYTASLSSVRNYPFSSLNDVIGSTLCTPDFRQPNTVGSYGFYSDSRDYPEISITQINLPIDPLLPLTDLVVRNDVAYISTDSNIAPDPDLMVLDISSTSQAFVISTINTGPGISMIALARNYIFASAVSTASQLHIIGLDDLPTPILVEKYRLPLPESSTTPTRGSSIFYDKDIVYLGTEKWDGDELNAINVSIPENPIWISGVEVGSKVNAIYTNQELTYVGASGVDQLITINTANPNSLYKVSQISPSGFGRQEGKAISYFEDSLAFGRTSGGFDILADHELFVWPSSASTLNVNSPFHHPDILQNPISVNIPGGVYGIVQGRHNTYVATRNINKELMVFDTTTASSTSYSLPVQPQKMVCDGHRIYILPRTGAVLYEITSK